MKLTVNVATMGRPEEISRMLDISLKNVKNPETVFMVSVDSDDEPTRLAVERFGDAIFVNCQPREDDIGSKWARALERPSDVYMLVSDCAPVVTPGFDDRTLEAAALFPDNIGCVYSHMASLMWPTTQSITHGLVKQLGFLYPDYFPYWFVDHWIDDIARMIGRISFADVQAPSRSHVTHERREVKFWSTFFDLCGLERRAQARAIIDSPEFLEPEWRKELLRRHHPLVEHRSLWVNAEVRRMGIADAKEDGGERYQRLRARAVKKVEELLPELHRDYEQEEERIRRAA